MNKTPKIWIVCLVATLLLLLAGGGARAWMHRVAGEGEVPFETAAGWVRRHVGARIGPAFRAQAAVERMQRLEDEVARLRIDAMLLEQVAEENRQLRLQANLPPRASCRVERCLAISRGGSLGWWRSIRVNKGSSSGIAPGDAVVAPDGLVGRVRAVTATTAEIIPITDPNCRIACALDLPPGRPSARGILTGAGWRAPEGGADLPEFLYVAAPMRLDYLDRDLEAPESGGEAPLPARTRIVTSGLSGTIPGGIPVGWLVSTELEPNRLYRTGTVLPAVDFANLTTLFVLASPGRSP